MTREEMIAFVEKAITDEIEWTTTGTGGTERAKRNVTAVATRIAERWEDDVIDQRAEARAEGAQIATGGF